MRVQCEDAGELAFEHMVAPIAAVASSSSRMPAIAVMAAGGRTATTWTN